MSKGILLGEKFPDFQAETSESFISSFHDWIGENSWAILFSHPRDFTPVCTTELARLVQLAPEFKKRNVKLIGLSCDSAQSHREWADDIIALCKMKFGDCGACSSGNKLPFPIIADENRSLATKLGMMDPDERDEKGAALTARCLFIIGPEKTLKLSILYPATTGRNFDFQLLYGL
ncbi:1-Cys peroxiredoxin, variant [Loa loa]|uniref:1-Cys peroxiredoxin, variant n=1 Tax=Loa loa TaxID=7209 RepID=A0A1S0UM35_LOALO|nr:1-Cys peroxiredoxin, variant [Loa loa]EJD76541.1 1-Cys peroxiredoxin, variant [Loa loa]